MSFMIKSDEIYKMFSLYVSRFTFSSNVGWNS